ncbi:hypothetical protein [Methylobacterium sp. Leaf118]|uniref:hypothetical protein n=1 Tax=Methylobacterium sp. Leaf118 TaxID=2876562 RepID=UPI001E65C541|nr:hypothetical protein [Methylobacterium sp. Leaf118]
MRPLLVSTALSALLALTLPAVAQQGAGWVDPPAKPAEPSKPAPETAELPPAARPETPAPAAREARSRPRFDTRAAASEKTAEETRDETRRAARGTRRAGELRQARRQAAREAALRAHRPAVAPPLPSQGQARAEPDPRFPEWAGTAQRMSVAYLDSVSSPGEGMVAAAPRFYGERIRFHGRTMSLSALMAEKRRFVRRWPERSYEPQGEPRVGCDAGSATCLVRIVHTFTAASPGRGTRSQGLAELVLTVSFAGGRPVIVAESSRVLRRGSLTASAGGPGGA